MILFERRLTFVRSVIRHAGRSRDLDFWQRLRFSPLICFDCAPLLSRSCDTAEPSAFNSFRAEPERAPSWPSPISLTGIALVKNGYRDKRRGRREERPMAKFKMRLAFFLQHHYHVKAVNEWNLDQLFPVLSMNLKAFQNSFAKDMTLAWPFPLSGFLWT